MVFHAYNAELRWPCGYGDDPSLQTNITLNNLLFAKTIHCTMLNGLVPVHMDEVQNSIFQIIGFLHAAWVTRHVCLLKQMMDAFFATLENMHLCETFPYLGWHLSHWIPNNTVMWTLMRFLNNKIPAAQGKF